MKNETTDLIESFYNKGHVIDNTKNVNQIFRKKSKAKYHIFDEDEFTRGRQVLGDLIVQGMITSGGTDIDWLIEHNGGFIILEFKGFHNDKINLTKGQMIAYERIHEKLNQATKCYLYVVGYDNSDFLDPNSNLWIFEMNQWKAKIIPKNTGETDENKVKQNKFIVYREYMEEINVEKLRKLIDSHWKEFELSLK